MKGLGFRPWGWEFSVWGLGQGRGFHPHRANTPRSITISEPNHSRDPTRKSNSWKVQVIHLSRHGKS